MLAGEEHPASALIHHGAMAEQAGFSFLFVSDHFHPWNSQQGHGSSIWPVLGALATATRQALLISAVTCPLFRLHPTTLAQAAATVQALSEGRFILGLGTGEKLNEHVTGLWPPFAERARRLEEVVAVLRALFQGDEVNHHSEFYQVHRARLYDPPKGRLPIALAASGPKAAALAGRLGDGLISLSNDAPSAVGFRAAGGHGKPTWTQISVCWAADEELARQTAHRLWPLVALEGQAFAALETPEDVEKACEGVTIDDVAATIVCGCDPLRFREAINDALAAGYDGVALHQIGPDQEGFLDFFRRELLPFYAR